MWYELAIVGGTVLVYQLIQFVRHQTQTPQEPKARDDAVCIETGTWLPASHTAQSLPIPDAAQKAAQAPITDTSLLYPLSEAALRLAQSNEANDFAFGYGWDSQLILHIHCNTIFENATPDMLRFWFINHGNGRGRFHWYKWWHPVDHKRAWWSDEQTHPAHDGKNGYVGHTSYVYEYLCKSMPNTEMDYLRIHFVDPTEFGFKPQTSEDRAHREIVCARAGFLAYQVESSQFIHYFEPYGDNGCIMKSRFWVGNASVDESVPVPLRWIIRFLFSLPFMRKVLIPADIGQRILTHCAKEMNNLAAFLPELYELYHQKK